MMRIGIGYDLHRLVEGRPLVLGGVEIPHIRGLDGHSDADVLTHAIIDAVLGAAGLGNIGKHFPDTDPAFRGIRSLELLGKAVGMAHSAGYCIVNIDSNVIAQAPRLAPYIETIQHKLADCIGIDPACVSVKAKTNECVGPEGREEAISAQAVALIVSE